MFDIFCFSFGGVVRIILLATWRQKEARVWSEIRAIEVGLEDRFCLFK
jgi:hypothetical protein